jgi:hypothetical protein
MPRIIIDYGPSGEIEVKTEGFKGAKCREATKMIEAALGATVSDEATSEMYETENTREKVNVRG